MKAGDVRELWPFRRGEPRLVVLEEKGIPIYRDEIFVWYYRDLLTGARGAANDSHFHSGPLSPLEVLAWMASR